MKLHEDIFRIKEVMGINEQSNSSNVIAAYSKLVDAVKGPGTDPDGVLSAITMLKNRNEFFDLQNLMLDKQTGYEDFEEMINQEYESDNFEDALKLTRVLEKFRIYTTFKSNTSITGERLFDKNFQFTVEASVDEDCQKRYNEVLPTAIKFWKDWLSDPTTIEKIKKNWGIKPTFTSGIMVADNRFDTRYKQYFDILDKIKLVFYTNRDNYSPDSTAFINTYYPNTIFVNCSELNRTPESTLIHEIQHLLWGKSPMNSKQNIGKIFDNNGAKTNDANLDRKIEQIEKSMGVKSGSIFRLYQLALEAESYMQKSYICNENEKMSNIMAIRKLFNIKPGQKITVQMLKPYIEEEQKNNQINMLLYCWVLNSFPDINQMINRLNDLALNQNNKQQSQSDVA